MNKKFAEEVKKQDLLKSLRVYKMLFLLCLGLCLITSGLFVYDYVKHENLIKEITGSRFPLLDPMRNIMSNKDAITNIQPIRSYMENLEQREKENANISIYFEYLNTGSNISINKDLKLWPVSLAKVPLAMIVMKKVEQGEWRLDQEFVATDENLNSGSGQLYKEGSGVKEKLSTLLEVLLKDSDNTAYRILKRETTQQERDEFVTEIGLDDFFKEDGKVSAKEYTRLFRSLYAASYLNREHSQYLLELMAKNNFQDFLNQGMPEKLPFAHKQGENVALNVYADSGIVYLENRPYLLSVMIQPKGILPGEARNYSSEIMKEISYNIYQYISNK